MILRPKPNSKIKKVLSYEILSETEWGDAINEKENIFIPNVYVDVTSTLKDKIKAIGNLLVSERHRHRFEFNNDYRKILEDKGLIISGTSPDDFFVEMIELPKKLHPFFIATQGHPEYKSKPLKPHPLFLEFIKAGLR